jgi:Uma2 family endonuclease
MGAETAMALDIVRHRFTIDDDHRMGEAGILSEDDRVELLDGEIVEMTPIGSLHASCVKRLVAVFTALPAASTAGLLRRRSSRTRGRLAGRRGRRHVSRA